MSDKTVSDAPRNTPAQPLPRADIVRRSGLGWAWLLPLLTLGLVGFLLYRDWTERGTPIVIELDVGHGLAEGDAVRYRGIDVGTVRGIELAPGLDRVRAEVTLDPHATSLARSGTRFWVARPVVGPSGVSGLETLIGARHLAVDPAPPSAPPATRFRALSEPPVEPPWDEGYEVLLEAPTRGGVTAGAPVLFRRFPVGLVTAVHLSSDASSVEFDLSIDPAYAELIRERTRFWETAGVELSFDLLNGLDLEFESLESILTGGISLAAPSDPGDRVASGRRFPLEATAPEGWTRWRPDVPLGAALLPDGVPAPRPSRVVLRWKERGWFGDDEQREGWALRVPGGLLGPSDLLRAPEDAREESARIEIDGRTVPVTASASSDGELALLADDGPGAAWPAARRRRVDAPEDVLLYGDLSGVPRALDAARLTAREDGSLEIDRSLSIPEDQHGAPVLARTDGALVGLLVIDVDGARVAPAPAH